jgi:hypothetical protein
MDDTTLNTRVESRKVSRVFLRERDFSRDQPCETKLLARLLESHGLARIVTARLPKTSFKTYFRHNNALIICLRQYSVLKIGLEFLARPGLQDETVVSKVSQRDQLSLFLLSPHFHSD